MLTLSAVGVSEADILSVFKALMALLLLMVELNRLLLVVRQLHALKHPTQLTLALVHLVINSMP
jgi:hypothetical protein